MSIRVIAAGAALLGATASAQQVPLAFSQVTISQSVIIRVPMSKPAAPVEWHEKKGPHCIPASELAGAQINSSDHVDLILRGGERLRAMLADDCPSLRYYSGFYLRPGADGRICADRDTLHTRSGGECEIDSFRLLVPKKAKRP